jgi:hypothetical protein
MSIIANLTALLHVEGLSSDLSFRKFFNTTATPTAVTHQRRVQATADAEEALDLGDISTVEYVLIYAVTNNLSLDCDFDTTYNADIIVASGEVAMFKPAGTVYVKNNDAGQVVTYEYIVIGTT